MFSKVKAEVDEKAKQRKMQELKPKHNQKLQQSKNPSFTTIEDGFFRFDHKCSKRCQKKFKYVYCTDNDYQL